jgi:REP element-mobilizing transposase RayT
MTIARSQLVDVGVTRYYHCISRCVRQAFLCGEGVAHRKQWIEDRLEHLARQFAVSVCGFAVMDNHLHVLVRLDPSPARQWSDEEVVRRWLAVYPPRNLDLRKKKTDPRAVQAWVEQQCKDRKRVGVLRERLGNLGWFMKALKEPLARLANKEDGCQGTFWEGRYKSIAILDEEALLATCAYIDLNPLAAGMAATPETSRHTSVRQRLEHVRKRGGARLWKEVGRGDGKGLDARGAAAVRELGRLEDAHWLCPVENRQPQGSVREGMVEGFTLGRYLLLVDYTSRLQRAGKARVSPEVAAIFERLGTSAEVWGMRLTRMLERARLMGSYFATRRQRLDDIAARRGVHHVDNTVPLSAAAG